MSKISSSIRKRRLIQTIVFSLITFLISSLYAGEIEILIDKLLEKNLLEPQEVQEILIQTKEEIKKSIAKGEEYTLPQWIQNISSKGDIRTRFQIDFSTSSMLPNRERARLRLRMGFTTRIDSNFSAGFGLATGAMKTQTISSTGTTATVGDGEPRSTNWTFTDTFSKPAIFVDYGYIQYEPSGWLTAYIGKFKNPVWQTTDLLWDTDLYPDGIAVPMKFKSGDMDIFLNYGYFIIDEIHNPTSKEKSCDPAISVIQPVVNKPVGKANLKLGLAYYKTNSIIECKPDHSAKSNTGAGTVKMHYVCTNPSIDFKIPNIAGYTMNIFADYVVNTATNAPVNQGNCAGIKFGSDKISGTGDWELKVMSRYLEKDAFLDMFPDSDAYGGATNSKGMELIFTYGVTKNLSLSIDYYNMTKIVTTDAKKDTKSLVQFDLVYKF